MHSLADHLPRFFRTKLFKGSLLAFGVVTMLILGLLWIVNLSPRNPLHKVVHDVYKVVATITGLPQEEVPEGQKIVAILLYDDMTALDVVGPMQSLGAMDGVKVVTVAKKRGVIDTDNNIDLVAKYDFDDIDSAYMLLVPGGFMGTYETAQDQETLDWIREIDKTTTYTTSTCTGAWLLAAAGLLDGKTASTHWVGKDYLESFGAHYSEDRYSVDGKYITSAGASAGIDMGLFLLGVIDGSRDAEFIQLLMHYAPEPPYNSGSPKTADPEMTKEVLRLNNVYLDWLREYTSQKKKR